MNMLVIFLKLQDIDVALLQEMTHNRDFDTCKDYVAIVNEGTDNRHSNLSEGGNTSKCQTLIIGEGCSGDDNGDMGH
jgi:hypothetical protein